MSETIKSNIVGNRVITDYKNSWRQLFNSKSDKVTVTATSDLCNGDFYSSEKLRFNRKVDK